MHHVQCTVQRLFLFVRNCPRSRVAGSVFAPAPVDGRLREGAEVPRCWSAGVQESPKHRRTRLSHVWKGAAARAVGSADLLVPNNETNTWWMKPLGRQQSAVRARFAPPRFASPSLARRLRGSSASPNGAIFFPLPCTESRPTPRLGPREEHWSIRRKGGGGWELSTNAHSGRSVALENRCIIIRLTRYEYIHVSLQVHPKRLEGCGLVCMPVRSL